MHTRELVHSGSGGGDEAPVALDNDAEACLAAGDGELAEVEGEVGCQQV